MVVDPKVREEALKRESSEDEVKVLAPRILAKSQLVDVGRLLGFTHYVFDQEELNINGVVHGIVAKDAATLLKNGGSFAFGPTIAKIAANERKTVSTSSLNLQ
jgi:hypothetical protein